MLVFLLDWARATEIMLGLATRLPHKDEELLLPAALSNTISKLAGVFHIIHFMPNCMT